MTIREIENLRPSIETDTKIARLLGQSHPPFPSYSETMMAASHVLAKLIDDGHEVVLWREAGQYYCQVDFDRETTNLDIRAEYPTMPLAICAAFLRTTEKIKNRTRYAQTRAIKLGAYA